MRAASAPHTHFTNMTNHFTAVTGSAYNDRCNQPDTLVIYMELGKGCKIFQVDDGGKRGANSVFLSPRVFAVLRV